MADETDDVPQWIRAGGDALLVNAPMSPNRFEDLAAWVADGDLDVVVDFGCGRGAFAHRVAELNGASAVVGIDTSAPAIDHAAGLSESANLAPRLRFECLDAADWNGAVDAAVCIGSSHALGGTSPMLERLSAFGASVAVIGDGFWEREPTVWCLENLGEMPVGIDAMIAIASQAGWDVESADTSTLDEWDGFERRWGDGVRSIGTAGALAFADERAEEYARYRGELGFAWLQLRRA